MNYTSNRISIPQPFVFPGASDLTKEMPPRPIVFPLPYHAGAIAESDLGADALVKSKSESGFRHFTKLTACDERLAIATHHDELTSILRIASPFTLKGIVRARPSNQYCRTGTGHKEVLPPILSRLPVSENMPVTIACLESMPSEPVVHCS